MGLVAVDAKNEREEFFLGVIDLLKKAKVEAVVVLEDERFQVADSSSSTHEADVTKLLFERVNLIMRAKNEMTVVINDRPGGDTAAENRFLSASLDMLREGHAS